MNKIVFILLVFIGLTGCQNKSVQEIKKEISEYRTEIVDLESKIYKLEKILADSNQTHVKSSILVGVQDIKARSFTHYLDISGNVETQIEAFISPEINGLIKNIDVKEGDYVKKGQKLVNIDTDITQNAINEVQTQLNLAKTIYKKQKELWDQNIGSEVQYLQSKANKEALENKLKTLHTQLNMATITAPFDSYVETVFQKIGEIGSPGRQIIHLVNLKELKVTANLSESYIPYVHIGDTATIEFPTFPGISIRQPINVIGSVINPSNRTIKIQIPIYNKANNLKPNIIAQIKLVDLYSDSAFVVPSIVVKNDAKGNKYVYVTEFNNKLIARKRFIKTGKSYGNKTMVTEGLEHGDQLIVQGYNLVKNGSIIRLK